MLTFEKYKLKPLVKWAGGKRQLLSKLIEKLPAKWKNYYEPFVGGGALLVELYNRNLLKKAIISDLNKDLINLYNVVKYKPYDLIEALKDTKFKNDRETYIQLRERFNEIRDSHDNEVECAALFIYLNRHGYNGLWRVNKEGKFNVPFGKYKNPSMPDDDLILEFSKMLQNVEILNEDFEHAVRTAESGDFIYFDPPYLPISKTSNFTDYTSEGFDIEEQKRLARLCKELSDRRVYIMVSNSDTSEITKLYEKYDDFYIYRVTSNRLINSKTDRRKGAREVIITNYEAKVG